jgi:hypothetical protein
MIKQVSDFIPESIDRDSTIIFVGISPSSKTKAFKNGTFARLKYWTDFVGIKKFDFFNVIPDVVNGMCPTLVDPDYIVERAGHKEKVVALGGFVSRILSKNKIEHLKIDHPSPRNRNLNSMEYELTMLLRLREYVNEH